MDPLTIIAMVNSLLGVAFRLYDAISQIQGNQAIPTWDELVDKNRILQAQIDAESK